MAPFTENEIARIREIANQVGEALMARIQERLDAHEAACPWGKRVNKLLWLGGGVAAALAVLGVRTLADLVRLIGK